MEVRSEQHLEDESHSRTRGLLASPDSRRMDEPVAEIVQCGEPSAFARRTFRARYGEMSRRSSEAAKADHPS